MHVNMFFYFRTTIICTSVFHFRLIIVLCSWSFIWLLLIFFNSKVKIVTYITLNSAYKEKKICGDFASL